MTRRATNSIESVGEGPYQRVYIPASLSDDSTYPFEPDDEVRLQLVETTCDREVLAISPERLEVDVEATAIEISEAPTEQLDLDLQGAGADD